MIHSAPKNGDFGDGLLLLSPSPRYPLNSHCFGLCEFFLQYHVQSFQDSECLYTIIYNLSRTWIIFFLLIRWILTLGADLVSGGLGPQPALMQPSWRCGHVMSPKTKPQMFSSKKKGGKDTSRRFIFHKKDKKDAIDDLTIP